MTELITGLGMLGFSSIGAALDAQPAEMVSVSPEMWARLRHSYEGGALAKEFESAWANGLAFLQSTDGLRHRRPLVIEWKGSHRAPGDEVAPIDLRIDHVFLVSCKYLSKIMINPSPVHLFERLLQGGHGARDSNWYSHVAFDQQQALYACVREELGLAALPLMCDDLSAHDHGQLSVALRSRWPSASTELRQEFVDAVASETADRWRDLAGTLESREAMLWRMLRMGSAPYFVLGSSVGASLRLRVASPWDWRREFQLASFEIASQAGGQPRVGWEAVVENRHSRVRHEVVGHVEIRWSHGQFSGNPEAKVYLDTPHDDVPGYFALE